MGIKNLTKAIEKYSPKSIKNVQLSHFKNKTIVIESTNWFYKYWKKTYSDFLYKKNWDETITDNEIINAWVGPIINFIRSLEREDINLIFVFDGKPPEAKSKTKQEREKDRENSSKKLEEIKEKLKNIDILDDTNNLIKEYRKYAIQVSKPTFAHFNILKEFLKAFGQVVLQAEGEGEKLASALVIDKKADAVLSTDTDNLTFGCHTWISDFDSKSKTFKIYNLEDVLSGFKFDMNTFIDFCIMCGCDYNNQTNIPRCGPVKNYQLMTEHKNIDNLPFDKEKYKCLEHEICRKEFQMIKSEELCKNLNFDRKKDHNYLRDFSEKYELSEIIKPNFISDIEYINDVIIEEFI